MYFTKYDLSLGYLHLLHHFGNVEGQRKYSYVPECHLFSESLHFLRHLVSVKGQGKLLYFLEFDFSLGNLPSFHHFGSEKGLGKLSYFLQYDLFLVHLHSLHHFWSLQDQDNLVYFFVYHPNTPYNLLYVKRVKGNFWFFLSMTPFLLTFFWPFQESKGSKKVPVFSQVLSLFGTLRFFTPFRKSKR